MSQASTKSFEADLNNLRAHMAENARVNNENITTIEAQLQSLQQQINQLKFQIRPQDYKTPIISTQAHQALTYAQLREATTKRVTAIAFLPTRSPFELRLPFAFVVSFFLFVLF